MLEGSEDVDHVDDLSEELVGSVLVNHELVTETYYFKSRQPFITFSTFAFF